MPGRPRTAPPFQALSLVMSRLSNNTPPRIPTRPVKQTLIHSHASPTHPAFVGTVLSSSFSRAPRPPAGALLVHHQPPPVACSSPTFPPAKLALPHTLPQSDRHPTLAPVPSAFLGGPQVYYLHLNACQCPVCGIPRSSFCRRCSAPYAPAALLLTLESLLPLVKSTGCEL